MSEKGEFRMKKAALLLIAAFALVMLIGCSTIKEIEVPSSYEFTPGLTSGREYVVLGQVSSTLDMPETLMSDEAFMWTTALLQVSKTAMF